MQWTKEIPKAEGWYGMHYALIGVPADTEYPMVEFVSTQDIADYQEDLDSALDDELEIWFYGPLKLEIPALETGRTANA